MCGAVVLDPRRPVRRDEIVAVAPAGARQSGERQTVGLGEDDEMLAAIAPPARRQPHRPQPHLRGAGEGGKPVRRRRRPVRRARVENVVGQRDAVRGRHLTKGRSERILRVGQGRAPVARKEPEKGPEDEETQLLRSLGHVHRRFGDLRPQMRLDCERDAIPIGKEHLGRVPPAVRGDQIDRFAGPRRRESAVHPLDPGFGEPECTAVAGIEQLRQGGNVEAADARPVRGGKAEQDEAGRLRNLEKSLAGGDRENMAPAAGSVGIGQIDIECAALDKERRRAKHDGTAADLAGGPIENIFEGINQHGSTPHRVRRQPTVRRACRARRPCPGRAR